MWDWRCRLLPEGGRVLQRGAARQQLALHAGDLLLQAPVGLLLRHEVPRPLLQRRDRRQLVSLRPPLLLLHLQITQRLRFMTQHDRRQLVRLC